VIEQYREPLWLADLRAVPAVHLDRVNGQPTLGREEAKRLLQKMRDRAAREGKEVRIEEEERGESRPEIRAQISVHGGVWRREAAKIGLAAGSKVYIAEWRASEDAARLREWMHDRDPRAADGKAPALVPTPIGNLALLVRRDEHLQFFTRLQDAWTYAMVVLFGTAMPAVPVACTFRTAHPGAGGGHRCPSRPPGSSRARSRPRDR
jgi:hypothetical protein